MSYATKKFPGVTDYSSIWKMKSQLVNGKEFSDCLWKELMIYISTNKIDEIMFERYIKNK